MGTLDSQSDKLLGWGLNMKVEEQTKSKIQKLHLHDRKPNPSAM